MLWWGRGDLTHTTTPSVYTCVLQSNYPLRGGKFTLFEVPWLRTDLLHARLYTRFCFMRGYTQFSALSTLNALILMCGLPRVVSGPGRLSTRQHISQHLGEGAHGMVCHTFLTFSLHSPTLVGLQQLRVQILMGIICGLP